MSSRYLLGSVAVIILLTTVAYFSISPYARKAVAERAASFSEIRESYEAGKSLEDAQGEVKEVEKVEDEDAEENGGVDDESERAPLAKPATIPTPTATTPAQSPTQTKPASSAYTLATVAQHADASSCWSAIGGKVYDLTSFISRHPGGEKRILKICGKDGTAAFAGEHGGDTKPEQMLASMYIGTLTK